MNIIIAYDKIYIYSPSLHQDLYQKLNKCYTNYITIHKVLKVLKEKDIDIVIDEIVNNKDIQKSDTEKETYKSIEELKFPQDFDDGRLIILDDLEKKEISDFRVQAMFKRSRNNNLSIFIIIQDYYELPKETIRANGNIYHNSNQLISEMWQISIKTKHPWIRPLKNKNT